MQKKYYRWLLFLGILLCLTGTAVMLALCIGEINYSPKELFHILCGNGNDIRAEILWKLRFPRILLGMIVGGALSLSGAILQGIFRNPLVEPYTLGISGGASLGVVFIIVFSLEFMWGSLTLPLSGFLGALGTLILIYLIAMKKRSVQIKTLLLTGVMISFLSSSVMMLMLSITRVDKLKGIMFWIMGGLNETNGFLIGAVGVIAILVLLLSIGYAPTLNVMRLGMERATQLGVNTEKSVRILFIFNSLLTGICVSVAGVIGFVGLIIPQLIRYIVGTDYRILLISSFLGGGIFLVLCDILARTLIAPNELPIGVITGITGGVLFILVMARGNKNSV